MAERQVGRVKSWKKWLEEKRWRQLKKSDWIVLALVGVLLLVIAVPLERTSSPRGSAQSADTAGADGVYNAGGEGSAYGSRTDGTDADGGRQDAAAGGWDPREYAAYLEERLEEVLSQMDGVGGVEVMVTVADAGELVVEKDRTGQTSVTEESDSAGGSRTVSQAQTEESTVYVENGQESYPYVQREKLPTVTGVVVVAEGAGSSAVNSEILDSVMALLPVEVHRIKVVKMCSKEESK